VDQYVALDVSLKETSVCVLNANGTVVFEGPSPSDPSSLARIIRTKAPNAVKIGLETGATSVWLWHALRAEGLPAVCTDVRCQPLWAQLSDQRRMAWVDELCRTACGGGGEAPRRRRSSTDARVGYRISECASEAVPVIVRASPLPWWPQCMRRAFLYRGLAPTPAREPAGSKIRVGCEFRWQAPPARWPT
jgi:hypothetical protein